MAQKYPKMMDMPLQAQSQARGTGGNNILQVMPPSGFATGTGSGKSDVILTTNDPKGMLFDFNRDNVLYKIDGLLQHVRSGGIR